MLLAVDIGNTHIVLGLYRGKDLVRQWRISTDRRKTGDEYYVFFKNLFCDDALKCREITGAIIACVVPPVLLQIQYAIEKLIGLPPKIISDITSLGMPVLVDHPSDVGEDRIVNSIAGLDRFGGPVVIIDLGTATTFDVVSENGEYLGGIIAPGLMLSLEALSQKTSRLPNIKVANPGKIIGKNTVECMQSGILFGYAGLIEHLIEKISVEMGKKPIVVATGGLASLIETETKKIDYVANDLTLWGLYLIYQRLGNY